MIGLRKLACSAFVVAFFASPVSAQICKEPNSTVTAPDKHVLIDCDQSMRDTVMTCDPVPQQPDENGVLQDVPYNNGYQISEEDPLVYKPTGTRPSCPATPMPMMHTPPSSFITDYSPQLMTYLRIGPNLEVNPADCTLAPKSGSKGIAACSSRPYNGNFAIGASAGPDRVFNMFGPPPAGSTRLSGCIMQLGNMTTPILGTKDEAEQNRLIVDNCTNQYILNWAMYPFQKSRSRLIGNPSSVNFAVDQRSECQPLTTFPEMENEYVASDYILLAWKKLLVDATTRQSCVPATPPATGQRCVGGTLSLTMNAYLKSAIELIIGVSFQMPTGLIDHAPHLPAGIQISNPIKPPNPFPQVNLSDIAAQTLIPTENSTPSTWRENYEEINDPSHPYSPRWDYTFTDRDYSLLVKTAGYETSDAAMPASVYCAGVHKDQNSGDNDQQKADAEVKVDVLSFREPPFTRAIANRVGFNYACFKDTDGDQESITGDYNPLTNPVTSSFCYQLVLATVAEFAVACFFGDCDTDIIKGKRIACWKCFGLPYSNDEAQQVDDSSNHPPCSTHWDGHDDWISPFNCGISPCIPGARNGGPFQWQASCSIDNPVDWPPFKRQSKYNIDKVCHDLRRPLTIINKLKMRYYNPAEKDNNTLQNGIPEGYLFKQYFGNHMPYPRMWDSGLSLQYGPNIDRMWQDPYDTAGQYTAIVGVGRESVAGIYGSDLQSQHPDERCEFGGWGGVNLGGVTGNNIVKDWGVNEDGSFKQAEFDAAYPPVAFTGVSSPIQLPDSVTSWTELKLYQTNTERYVNISCLGRYDKAFKPGGAEDIVLSAVGGEWSHMQIQKCPTDKTATNRDCTFISLTDYLSTAPASDLKHFTITQLQQETWPLGWRGYMADGTGKTGYQQSFVGNGGIEQALGSMAIAGTNQFPQFGGALNTAASMGVGLDKVQLGDVIVLPRGGTKNLASAGDLANAKPGLAKVGLVTEVHWPTGCPGNLATTDCYIKVMEPDNGKFPDVCGTTSTWGQLKSRLYYPPGGVTSKTSSGAAIEFTALGSNASCENTTITPCELSTFFSTAFYRPSALQSVRQGCNQPDAVGCK